jgi:hypothetical protein
MHGDDVFPFLIATGMFVLVPLVWMLLKHQQKMAELLHQRQNAPAQATDPALLAELGRLRDAVAQQAIAIDSLATAQQRLEASTSSRAELEQRLVR